MPVEKKLAPEAAQCQPAAENEECQVMEEIVVEELGVDGICGVY